MSKLICWVFGHFWLPSEGWQNDFETSYFPGAWGVGRVYCARCRLMKDL